MMPTRVAVVDAGPCGSTASLAISSYRVLPLATRPVDVPEPDLHGIPPALGPVGRCHRRRDRFDMLAG
jgi:hypothetical protein